MVNHILCHKVVEHIKCNNSDMLDAADLDEDFEGALKACGWHLNLTSDERDIIYHDLYSLALSNEVSEVSRLVFDDSEHRVM